MGKRPLDYADCSLASKRQRQEDGLPTEQVVRQQPPVSQPHNEEHLCGDCRTVDWSSLPILASDGSLKTKNLELRSLNATIEQLRNSSCRICAILSTIKKPHLDGDRCVLKALPLARQYTYDGHLLSFQLKYRHNAPDVASRCTVLGVLKEKDRSQVCHGPRTLAVVKTDDLVFKTVPSRSIDYDKLKGLVKTCQEGHKRCCAAQSRSKVLGLEVINTRTQKIIKAPDKCKYLALSYVWGKQNSDSSVHGLQNSPPVIKDAISVTNSMGYRYLWVDRYCISDPKDKHRMISQMNQIYANASITIIAAADGDTEMGLCGVSRPRLPQNRVDIQDVTLLDLPLGHEDLTSSKWASRGWTYQEGYLSTRRLIFTETQTLFLCNGMYAAESLQQLLSATCCSPDTADFTHLIPKFTVEQRKLSLKHLLNQVEEYSKRDLTHPSDSLNAFLGVLNYSTQVTANLASPVVQLPWGLIAKRLANKNFMLYFFWYHEDYAIRRRDFPSWSWTGWGGPLTFWKPEIVLQPEHKNVRRHFSYLTWQLSMREDDGKFVTIYDLAEQEFRWRSRAQRLYQPGPKHLQVSCLVIPVRLKEYKFSEDQRMGQTEISIHDTDKRVLVGRELPDGVHPTLEIWEWVSIGTHKKYLRLDQPVERQDCILGLIFAESAKNQDWIYRCLLVRQTCEGLYERVGLLYIHDLALESIPPVDGRVYLNVRGDILDKFSISDRERQHPFIHSAARREICLI